jgi:hypothetical protein
MFKRYFIAHEGNDHHPHIFRARAVLAFLFCALMLESGLFVVSSHRSVRIGDDSEKAAVIANALVTYTNEARVSGNLPVLRRNALLDMAAQKKAEDMIANGYFAHYSPTGVTPWHWLEVAGYAYTSAGENLAIDFFDSKDVVDAWMNSPTHRANIMKQKYSDIGMAVAEGEFNGHRTAFVVEFFGVPQIAAASASTPAVSTPTTTPTHSVTVASGTASVVEPVAAVPVTVNATPLSDATTTPLATTALIPTSTPEVLATNIVTATASSPEVAGAQTPNPMDDNFIARVSNQMFGFVASPRNATEMVLFVLIACVLLAALLYIHGSGHPKNPSVTRKVSLVTISLVLLLSLFIMMNRTFMRMSNDSLMPPAETAVDTEANS